MYDVMDSINMGILLIDREYRITRWNRWMEIQSEIEENQITGESLFKRFPHLNKESFIRSLKSVFKFGNYVYYSQKFHSYMFPFPPSSCLREDFMFMQQSCTLTPLRDENGEILHIVITVEDVTERVFMEQSMKELSQKDGLTGIYNRRYLDTRLKEEFIRFERKRIPFAFLMMDLDNFKPVNDTYGHQFGDVMLKEVADTCSRIIRGSDTLARFGGEEFCIILPDADEEGAKSFSERIRKSIEEIEVPYLKGITVSITVSIGLSRTSENVKSSDELLFQADKAMYESKKRGKNTVTFYPDI